MTAVVGAILLAGSLTVFGYALLWRFGGPADHRETLLRVLRTPGRPRLFGNLVIAALPASLSTAFLGASLIVGPGWRVLSVLAFSALGLIAAWFLAAPPAVAKARWLTARERTGEISVPAMSVFDKVVVAVYAICMAVPFLFIAGLVLSRLG